MIFSIKKEDLLDYTINQVQNLFPDRETYNKDQIFPHFNRSLKRMEYCFSKIDNKYFSDGENPIFNHLNGDQYSMYLYFLSNTLYNEGFKKTFLEKLFLLNKSLHGIDIFYEIELPDIFLFVHPLGTVLGRATYSNYLIVYQRCNVGANKNIYPTIGEHTTLHPGASVLGDCNIGNNCKIGANALILDKNLKDNSLYVGNPKDHHIIIRNEKNEIWK